MNIADLVWIPRIPYGPKATPKLIPEFRARSNFWALLGVAYKQINKVD